VLDLKVYRDASRGHARHFHILQNLHITGGSVLLNPLKTIELFALSTSTKSWTQSPGTPSLAVGADAKHSTQRATNGFSATRESWPDSGLGFQVKVLKRFKLPRQSECWTQSPETPSLAAGAKHSTQRATNAFLARF